MLGLIFAGAFWYAYLYNKDLERIIDIVYFIPMCILLGALVGLMFLPFSDYDLRVVTGAILLPIFWVSFKSSWTT